MLKDREALVSAISGGSRPSYLFFWGHRQRHPGVVDKSCLSQWFAARFTVDEILYRSAEQFMMARKAQLFGDADTHELILRTSDPNDAKRLGRRVRGFDEARWQDERARIVVAGNLAKFSQNSHLGRFLLGTGDAVLVEASPLDAIWGIGLDERHPNAQEPNAWPGLNLLGFALMEVRSVLRGDA